MYVENNCEEEKTEINLNQNAFFSTSKPKLWGLALFKLPLGSAVMCPCSQPQWQGSDLSPRTPGVGKRPVLLWPLKVQPTGSVQNLNPAPGRHSLTIHVLQGFIPEPTTGGFGCSLPSCTQMMTTAQQTEQQHPTLPWGGDVPGRAGAAPCSPGNVVLCPPEGGWEQKRKDVLTQTPVCASLIPLTYHLHLTKDIITDWNEILFILGADKYIFDIFILSDNFDYTSTTRITALVSAVLISAAQGKIANIKWSWH